MTAATHRLGGLAAGTALAGILHTDLTGSCVIMGMSMLGCLLPDIDNRQSAVSYKYKAARFLVAAGQAVLRGVSCIFPSRQKQYIRSLIGHRGLSHALLPAAFISLLVFLFVRDAANGQIAMYAAAGIFSGLMSHLVFDIFANGVPLFMPFSVKRVTLAHIKTGGFAEWVFRVCLIGIFCYFGIIREVLPWQKLFRL